MAVDLKVLVRSFNCESRARYVGNPREVFFRVREMILFIRESFAKVGYHKSLSLYMLQLVKGYRLPPPAARGPAGEWYRTIGSSHASEGEASPQLCHSQKAWS